MNINHTANTKNVSIKHKQHQTLKSTAFTREEAVLQIQNSYKNQTQKFCKFPDHTKREKQGQRKATDQPGMLLSTRKVSLHHRIKDGTLYLIFYSSPSSSPPIERKIMENTMTYPTNITNNTYPIHFSNLKMLIHIIPHNAAKYPAAHIMR